MQFGFAHVAQSVERVLGKDEVTSSSLVMGSRVLNNTVSKENRNNQLTAGDSNG
jgi:hypothetical protein